jgi:hypothetical protein
MDRLTMVLSVSTVLLIIFIVILTLIFNRVSAAKKSNMNEISLKPFLQSILKEDFDEMLGCTLTDLYALPDKFDNIPKIVGYSLFCMLRVGDQQKLWHTIISPAINPANNQVKAALLDEVLQVKYVYEDGCVVGLLNSLVPIVMMFNPNGQARWRYLIRSKAQPNPDNICMEKVIGGYIIAAYSSRMPYEMVLEDKKFKVLEIFIEKIDKQGKLVLSDMLSLPVRPESTLFDDHQDQAVRVWGMDNGHFAVSVRTRIVNKQGETNEISFDIHYYEGKDKWKSHRFDITHTSDIWKKFGVDRKGNIRFASLTKDAPKEHLLPNQLRLNGLEPNRMKSWQQDIIPEIPPANVPLAKAAYLIWELSEDEAGNYLMLCEQRYKIDDKWINDDRYDQLFVCAFTPDGQLISKTMLFKGNKMRDFRHFLYQGEGDRAPYITVPLKTRDALYVGVAKKVGAVTRKQLETLLSSRETSVLEEEIGIKIYQVPLPKK